MRRIALMFIAALVALIGLVPLASAAQAVPSVEAAAYTYDTPAYGPPGNGAASERGPPAQGLAATAYDAVDHWSRGTLARPDGLTTPSSTTDAYPAMFGQVEQAAPTTAHQAVVADGQLSSVQPAQDAANSARLLAKVNRIESHLARPEISYAARNDAMLARLRSAAAEGTPLSRADRAFMRHELTENWLMNRGMGIDRAHNMAGWTHRTYGNFDPSVIKQLPQEFNSNWRNFWGIE